MYDIYMRLIKWTIKTIKNEKKLRGEEKRERERERERKVGGKRKSSTYVNEERFKNYLFIKWMYTFTRIEEYVLFIVKCTKIEHIKTKEIEETNKQKKIVWNRVRRTSTRAHTYNVHNVERFGNKELYIPPVCIPFS